MMAGMTTEPVAYIRRSVARRGDPGDVSREFQTDKVRALANGDGPALRIIDGDWGISADREKTHRRLGFLELMESVERGEVSMIYAFALDRLARSVQWSARLLDACEDAGAIIVTGEGRFDPAEDRDRQMFHFYAMQNEGALRGMKRKAQASIGTRRNRGDTIGQRPYGEVRTRKDGVVVGKDEDPALIIATYREAGSYFAAARLLNDREVPTRNGAQWYPRTVQRIVNRHDPATVPLGGRKGARSFGSRPLSGLLVCHCKTPMTQTTSHWAPKYRCPRGVSDPDHPRPYIVSEAKLLPAAEDEAERLKVPADLLQWSEAPRAALAALEAKREGIGDAYAVGAFGPVGSPEAKAKLTSRLEAIDAEAERLQIVDHLDDIPQEVDWSWPPERLNAVLRALWERIELGPDLHPVRFVWRVPEWRAQA
jgi:DNA invertase Pin-like site-specific DNA recombinase